MFKFEGLEVWKLAVEYVDLAYSISARLPKDEEYNLKSQVRRAATSIALNIAEGSTGQSDPEQARFLSMALRSVLETVACLHLIARRDYLADAAALREAYARAEVLSKRLQAMKRAITKVPARLAEEPAEYELDDRRWTTDHDCGAR